MVLSVRIFSKQNKKVERINKMHLVHQLVDAPSGASTCGASTFCGASWCINLPFLK